MIPVKESPKKTRPATTGSLQQRAVPRVASDFPNRFEIKTIHGGFYLVEREDFEGGDSSKLEV